MIVDSSAKIEVDACAWVARLDRSLSATEQVALERWLSDDPRHRGALLRAQACFAVLDRGRALGESASIEDAAIGQVQAGWSRRGLLRVGGGSMAAALAFGIAWSLWPAGQSFVTSAGEMRRLPMRDGSLALLNTDTDLRTRFSRDRRDLELARGEAWFSVAKDAARPFTVAAGAARVRAVGTAFNVRRDGSRVDVVVTEGVVKIWSEARKDAPITVAAGHETKIDASGNLVTTAMDETRANDRLAWRSGRIVLDGTTMEDAAREFNRYNRRQLVVSPDLAGRTMVGRFRTDDVDAFTRAAASTLDAEVTSHGDWIEIAARR